MPGIIKKANFTVMENAEIINSIKENLEELGKRKNAEVKQLVNGIVRYLTRLKSVDKDIQQELARIASDLRMNEINEEKFHQLNNPTSNKTQYSEGFYSSLEILKEELLTLLSKLD